MSATPEVYALVTARGGSKGIPGKNLRLLGGRPLIAWTIEAARGARGLKRVLLSTDDPEIARVGREWGAEVPFMRPVDLAQDTSSHISVVNHALDWLESNGGLPEYLCLLQPTAPLRIAADIDAAIELARSRNVDAVVGVTEMKEHPFLARRIELNGAITEFVSTNIRYLRRQDLPPAYAINGTIYINRSTALRREQTFFPPGALAYVMPMERSVDIDRNLDLVVAEYLLQCRDTKSKTSQ